MLEKNLNILLRYYKHLAQFGYMNLCDVNKALIYTFLIEFVENYFDFLTECDLQLIQSKLNCLEGSTCLIPAEDSGSLADLISVVHGENIRSSETNIIRKTLNGNCYRSPLK